MKQCNECKRRKCDVVHLFRRGRRFSNKQLIDMSADCKRYMAPRPWKTKAIFLAMYNNAQSVHDVLQAFDMRLQELADKPYFRILLNKIHERPKHG